MPQCGSSTMLFDTGPVDFAIGYNGERLGVTFDSVDAVMISHGHWDHAGKQPYLCSTL